MASNWLYIDTNFPTFTGEEDLNEKVTTIQNYLFMLVEQMRYTLHNLDLGNMNTAAVNKFTETLTDPIYAAIQDADDNITQLSVTAQGIAGRVSDAEGSDIIPTLYQDFAGWAYEKGIRDVKVVVGMLQVLNFRSIFKNYIIGNIFFRLELIMNARLTLRFKSVSLLLRTAIPFRLCRGKLRFPFLKVLARADGATGDCVL